MASSGSEPIRFWFDFASPYAYFALPKLTALAARFGRGLDLRPTLLWAVFKAQGVKPPFDVPAREAYLLADMERSAAFYGLPLTVPINIPFSAHLAGRVFYGVQAEKGDAIAARLAAAMLEARFGRGADITRPDVVQALVAAQGLDASMVDHWAQAGRDALAGAVEAAIAEGIAGSPYMVLDGEGFFGADRLPQLEWRLAQKRDSKEM